eukprot:m.77641 g.77641  ORF g.77641 m.77641 type:complete len:1596 (+) comp16204_c0_seq5:127-4914(+)
MMASESGEAEIELKAGFLLKSPEIKSPDEWTVQKWSKRWFVLTAKELRYYGDREKKDLKRTVSLADVSAIKHAVPSNKHKHLFSVRFNAGSKQREMFIESLTDEERTTWADAITTVTMTATDGNVLVHKLRQSVSGSTSKPLKKPSVSENSMEGSDEEEEDDDDDADDEEEDEFDPDLGDADVVHTGVLYKAPKINFVDSTSLSKWQDRYFVLSKTTLQYFTDVEESACKGEVELKDCTKLTENVPTKKYKNVFSMVVRAREYFFSAPTYEARTEWVSILARLLKDATGGSVQVDRIPTTSVGDLPAEDDNDTGTYEVPTVDAGASVALKDVLEEDHIWPTIHRWVGNALAHKSPDEMQRMLTTEDHKLVKSPEELEDFLVTLLDFDDDDEDDNIARIDLLSDGSNCSVEHLYEMLTGGSQTKPIKLTQMLQFLSPALAETHQQGMQQVVQDVRASFSMRKRPGVQGDDEDFGVSTLDAIAEGEKANEDAEQYDAENIEDDEAPEESADYYVDAADDDSDLEDEWDADVFAHLPPSGMVSGSGGDDAEDEVDTEEDGADDDTTGPVTKRSSVSTVDPDSDSDDDDEGPPEDPQHKAYPTAATTPRCYDKILEAKYVYSDTPTECDRSEHFQVVIKMLRMRKRYVRLGARRDNKKGVKLKQAIDSNLERLRSLIAEGPKAKLDEVCKGRGGQTILHLVCSAPFLTKDVFKLLLAAKVNTNIPDAHGRTPLHLVLAHKHVKATRRLLASGANPNVQTDAGKVPLLQAMDLQRSAKSVKKPRLAYKLTEVLVQSGRCNLDMSGDEKRRKRNPPLIQVLLHGDPKGKKGLRARRNLEPFVHLLTAYGADPNVRANDSYKTSAFWIALEQVKRGKWWYAPDCIGRRCLAPGAKPLQPDVFNEYDGGKHPYSPFFMCAAFRQADALLNLFDLKASGQGDTYRSPKLKGLALPPECSPFEAACHTGSGEVVQGFLDLDEGKYLPILTNTPANWTKAWKRVPNRPLFVIGIENTTHVGATHFAKLMLRYDLDYNAKYTDGLTLFTLMTALGHVDACIYLIDQVKEKGLKPVDLSSVDVYHRNAAFYAAYGCTLDRTRLLKRILEAGGDPRVCDSQGANCLLAAARNGDDKTMMILLNKPFTPFDRTVRNRQYEKPRGSAKSPEAGQKHKLSYKAPQRASRMVPKEPRQAIYGKTEGYVLPENDVQGQKVEKNWAAVPRQPYTVPTAGESYDDVRHVSANFRGFEGDELNAPDKFGYSPLWYAVLHCNADMVRMLIADPKVDVNVQNVGGVGGFGMTPIMLAACVVPRGKLDIFFMLLNHPDIDLSLKAYTGATNKERRKSSLLGSLLKGFRGKKGFTLYDICYMEELEFAFHPMTDALKKRGCDTLSTQLKCAKHFEKPSGVRWNNPRTRGSVKMLVAKKANKRWAVLQKKLPAYTYTLALRALVMYDYTAQYELKRESIRSKKDAAKRMSFRAAQRATALAHALHGNMHPTMRFLKKAAIFAELRWIAFRATRVRGYDIEVHRARSELKRQGTKDVDAVLWQPTAKQCIQRRHIPEDFKQKRYHVGRYQSLQEPPGLRRVESLLHKEKWAENTKPKTMFDWS